MTYRLFACALLCLMLSSPAHAAGEYRTVDIESLSITFDSEWSAQTAPGYWPVRFDIANLGGGRVIEIVSTGNRWWNSGESETSEIHRTLLMKPGDRIKLTIPVPVFGDSVNAVFQIRESGRILQAFNYSGLESNKPSELAAALIVADPSSPLGTAAEGWLRSAPRIGRYAVGGGGAPAAPKLDFILEPSRLPSDWLGFTSLRAVLIGQKEWTQLAAAQKDALLTWLAAGGELFFVDGDLKTLIPDQSQPAALRTDSGAPTSYYFGHIFFPSSVDMATAGLDGVLSMARDAVKDPGQSLPANRTPDWVRFNERGFRLPIPGVEGVPVRSYMAILIVFSVLIGPVNYVLLWRKKRQALLVLTAPLISVLFIVVIAGYALFGEGIGLKGSAESFTMLDQTSKHAATRASVSLYAAGMAPWNGLRFPREMAIFPTGVDGQGSREHESLDLTESQQFTSGIVRARAPSNFEEIAFRPARERLTFNRTDQKLTVVNGLGATLRQLFYLKDGALYTLSAPLAAGEQAALQAKAGGVLDAGSLPAKFRTIAWAQKDGTYLATLDHSPFLETGVARVDEVQGFHLVLGYPGAEQ